MMSSFAVQAVLHLLRLRKAGYFAVRWEVTWIAAPRTLHSAKASAQWSAQVDYTARVRCR